MSELMTAQTGTQICFLLSSRHIRQQGRRHPGPICRRLHRQRHGLQCRQRLPRHRRGVDHCGRRLALQGQSVQGGPGKPGLLGHPLHHPGHGVRHHAAVPAEGGGRRRRAGRAADLQDDNVAAVRLAVAGLHPAGFTGGLLPSTYVLNSRGEERGRHTANRREREGGRSLHDRRDAVNWIYSYFFIEKFPDINSLFSKSRTISCLL